MGGIPHPLVSNRTLTDQVLAAIFDGYAVTIPGNIVANPGFVAVFGTIQTSAGLVLDPRYVGAWTGVQSAGQIIGMWGGPFASDRFGRKWIMWLTTVWLLLVCHHSLWTIRLADDRRR